MSAHELTAAPPTTFGSRAGAQHHWALLPVVLAGIFMVVLDFFIVNVALPSMQADLHAGSGAVEWVVAGYGLTCAAGLITAGRLGDQLGRRRMFSLGLALFTLASGVCGLAWSPGALVVARLAQGVAAAMLMPQVLSIIGVAYSGADRVRALSMYGMAMGVAALGGQLIGGVLVQADIAGMGWRSCFLINLPIGIAALALTPSLVPEARAPDARRLDLVGTLLITLGLVAVILPLVEGRQHGWPAWTWLLLAVAPVVLAGFAAQQRRLSRRGGAPLLEPGLFRDRAFSAGIFTQLVFWSGQASFFLLLALYLQMGRGLDALQSGLVFTLVAAAYLVASMRAPALTERYGRRLIAAGGLALAAGHGLLLGAVADGGVDGSIALMVPGLLLVGTGMGLCITPLNAIVLANVEPRSAGSAAGVMSTFQQVGNALGTALSGVIFFGALDGGYAHAFELGVGQLALLGVVVAAVTRVLPR